MSDKGKSPGWIIFNQGLAIFFIVLTLVVVLLSTIFVARQDAIFRVCFEARGNNVLAGAGEAGAVVNGIMTMDATYNTVKYLVRTSVGMSGITAINVMGPIQLSTPQVGPLFFTLCGGAAGAPSCDTISVPGQVSGTVTTIYDGVPPEQTDVRTAVEQYRREPELYYVEILSNGKPATPGAARAPMLGTCGFE
jgi:hypothetical protein